VDKAMTKPSETPDPDVAELIERLHVDQHDPTCGVYSVRLICDCTNHARRDAAAALQRQAEESENKDLAIDNLRNMVDRALKILLMATPPDMVISKESYNPISAYVYEAQQMLSVIDAGEKSGPSN
jgi:hypothetical protein